MTELRVARPTDPPRKFEFAGAPESTSVRELLFLQRLSKAAASTPEPDALLELIMSETTGAMQVDVCSIYLYDPTTDEVVLTATNGLSQEMVGKGRLKLGHGVTGWVALHQQALIVPDVNKEARFQWVRGVDQKRLTAMLSVPIVAGTRMIGVVNVQTEDERQFDRGDIDFLLAIAGQVAGIIERSELQRRLQAQLEEIRGSQEVHERFTALSLSGAGVGAILEAIGSLAGTRVDLFDATGFRLERQGGREHAIPGITRIEIPATVLRGAAREPVEVRVGKPAHTVTLTPVRAGDELLAVLAAVSAITGETDDAESSAGGQSRSGDANRRRALEHGSTVLALEMAKARASAEVERRLRGDLVEELLGHGLTTDESRRLAAQAERLGYHIAARSWVVAVEPDDSAAGAALEARAMQDRLHQVVSDLCTRRFPASLVVTRSGSLVLIIPAGDNPELKALETFGKLILDTIHRVVGRGTFSLGIGNATDDAHQLPRAHDEARQSLRLARRGGAARAVTSYRNLGAFRLLLEVQDPAVLERFVEETLGPLVRYQEGRRTPLIETLEQLAANHWNRRAAARALHLHVNSLSYRAQRIESLLGVSLEDPETRVALSIALRARSLLPG
jgi:DNA-binding PucR family transcriptional regulator/putative methionine-R-sulfoxide reductase with GAF domain